MAKGGGGSTQVTQNLAPEQQEILGLIMPVLRGYMSGYKLQPGSVGGALAGPAAQSIPTGPTTLPAPASTKFSATRPTSGR